MFTTETKSDFAEKFKKETDRIIRELLEDMDGTIRGALIEAGWTPPKTSLEMRCLHCGLHLRHHAPATDECMDGSGKRFQPVP